MANGIINETAIAVADPEELEVIIKNTDREDPLYCIALDRLKLLASTDQLTTLYNRNMWPGKFIRELKYTDDNSKYLGCLLLDIDDFGLANKNLGHDFGDILLNSLGLCINNRLRHISREQKEEKRKQGKIIRQDIAGRYGGEEFIIFAPQEYDNDEEALHGLKKVGEKVQMIGEAVTTSAVMYSAYATPEKYITISLGCALYQGKPGKSAEYYAPKFDRAKIGQHPLIKKADEALLFAKKEGKNRSVCLDLII